MVTKVQRELTIVNDAIALTGFIADRDRKLSFRTDRERWRVTLQVFDTLLSATFQNTSARTFAGVGSVGR
jgi:hypothetical protein